MTFRYFTSAASSSLIVVSVAGLTYFSVSATLRPSNDQLPTGPTGVTDVSYNPFEASHGKHLVAFALTASDCGWSQRPEGKAALANLRETLFRIHGPKYAQISVIGVGLDHDPKTAFAFLSTLSTKPLSSVFDQIVVGGSWLNEEVVRFVWRDKLTEAALPQVLVLERTIDTSKYVVDAKISASSDRLVALRRGESNVAKWLAAGVPLDEVPRRPDATEKQ